MRVVRHTDVAAFAAVAVPFLVASEAENNLLLGICSGLVSRPPARAPYLATVESRNGPVGVAIMTPPRKLVTSAAPAQALDALCADLVESGVPGVLGPAPTADELATRWRHHTGDGVHREREQRIYELTSLVAPPRIPGALRPAAAADLPIVEAWAPAFVADVGLRDDAVGVADDVRRAVRDGRLYVWDDGQPVTMATWTGPTPNGVRVTLVYTPPALRGRGYASSCVAALSALLLASGRRACFLFTDLANPTSNSIYAKIGYRPVCDVHDYRFERGGPRLGLPASMRRSV